ncbi:MAG: GAF domain-containing protein, partial [Solirubrobacteraceae bacterium]
MDSTESRVLMDLLQLEREVVELRYTLSLDAAERVREALRRLGEAGPPHEILERSAEELSASTHLEQTLVGRVDAGELAAISSAGVATPPGVVLGRLEAAAMSGDAAAVVDVSGHVTARALGWTECVLAPIRVHGEAAGLLYAAIPPGGRALAEFDRALVERFARGLGIVLEHAVLEHAVERHRA